MCKPRIAVRHSEGTAMRSCALACLLAALALPLLADTYTWTHQGGGSFSELSNWTLSSTGEAPAVSPGSGDAVVLPNASSPYTVTNSSAFSIGSLTVGGGALSGAPTLDFHNGLSTNVVAGAVVVKAGATLTHRLNNVKNVYYKLCLKCASLTVEGGGAISADKKGYPSNLGVRTGTYGGVGGVSNNATVRHCYGSIRYPMDIGATGAVNVNSVSGGVVYLEVSGAVVCDGTISAVSADNDTYIGTGGSVLILAATLAGSGTISAATGNSGTKNYAGGGGRVAVHLSEATSFDGFTGDITADAGKTVAIQGNCSGAGTVYLEHAGDVAGQGTLIIDNRSTKPNAPTSPTSFDSEVTDRNETFGTVKILNNATLSLPDGATLTVTKRLETGSGGGALRCAAGSAVVLAGSEDAVIVGANSFYSLSCAVPGKKISFGAGAANKTTIQEGGSLALSGAAGSQIVLRSLDEGTQWQLNVGANAAVSVGFCDVKDSDASAGLLIRDIDGVNSGNNLNWSVFPAPVPGQLNTWTGNSGTDWSDEGNWSLGRVPVETDRLLIPTGRANYPVISSTVTVNSLTNEASLTLSNNANLVVTNAFASFGTLAAGAYDELRLEGDGAQEVDLGGNSFSRIVVAKQGGSIDFKSGFRALYFNARAAAPLTFRFKPGATVEVGRLSLYGLSGASGAYTHLITLAPGGTGQWNLKATSCHHVRGVYVSGCNASQGATIAAGVFSSHPELDDGNENWDFSATAAAEWIGGGTSFSTAACWANGIVPGEGTQACICPPKGSSFTVNASGSLALGALLVGGDGGFVTFKSSGRLEVAGDMNLLAGSTNVLDYFESPNVVSHSLLVARDAVLTHSATTQDTDTDMYKLSIEVGGDAAVDEGGEIRIKANGHKNRSGTGRSQVAKSNYGPAHAGIGSGATNAYGSILRPFSLGSGGYIASAYGGGAVKLDVGGTLQISGTIDASGGGDNLSYAPGTGGSVWLTAARIVGDGTIVASLGIVGGGLQLSSGGRVALYQTDTIGWEGLSVTVDVSGYSSGTYYRQDATGIGQLFIDQQLKTAGRTYVPMPDDGSSNRAYRKVDVCLDSTAVMDVTNNWTWSAGSTLVLHDLDMKSSDAKLNCLGSKVKILSKAHKDGVDWTGGNYAAKVQGGKIVLGEGGEVYWAATGTTVLIR